ncbi:MAG: response regulator [Acidimicrobiia bacterium]|nr:response regulator [Acidimicrobiia bacterium]
MAAKILVVDDTPTNVTLLTDLLESRGYEVVTATSGPEGLTAIECEHPDLVLLDVMMPGMSGYEVCQQLRTHEATRLLPVVMVTSLDPGDERVKGIEAGADDFLGKPINTQELFARVQSLLRIKELHDTVQAQADELTRWNAELEQRVAAAVEQLGVMEQLKRFLSPQVAEKLASDGLDGLEPHRREVTVVFLDLRGFTAFAESAEPEEMMLVLGQFHDVMGGLISEHQGTLERFTGDGLMIVFNDPVEISDHELRAARMAVAMRDRAAALHTDWRRLGHDIHVGLGATVGYATIGMIGFEGRRDYSAMGSVCNLAARLCDHAGGGELLVSDRLASRIEDHVGTEPLGELELKGIRRPVLVHRVS